MIQIVALKRGMVYTTPKILVPSLRTLFEKYAEVVAKLPEGQRTNIFYTLASHRFGEDCGTPVRSAASFDYQEALAFDVDHAEPARFAEYRAAICNKLGAPEDSPTIVNSGNGLHFLFMLKNPVRQVTWFKQSKQAYSALCSQLDAILKENQLSGYLDTSILDPARVLRLPGTLHSKPDQPIVPCTLLQKSAFSVELDLQEASGLNAITREYVAPAEVKRMYPVPDLDEMLKECHFSKWITEHPEEAREPQVFDFFSLLHSQSPNTKVNFRGGPRAALEIAHHVFDQSDSSSLKRKTFDYEWEQSGKYGARKCETINDRWDDKCKGCPHWGKVPTPLALKGPNHISTAQTGFWVYNNKGVALHPHYGDLNRVYQGERNVLITPDEAIYTYTGTHYSKTEPIEVKQWVEKRVLPNDPLREAHRGEFLNKIKANSSVDSALIDSLFVSSVQGKLNCANGVVDIRTGQITDHSPQYGFRYTLPYDYQPTIKSEFFLEWLSEVMEFDKARIDSVLDFLAYILWPRYDDHCFTYFTGNGANGKSTLMNVIYALVGKSSYSSISLSQLVGNRFAPAALDGKLINVSGESSGIELDYDQENTLKSLSEGTEVFVENKGTPGYFMKNTAKLLFLSNALPKFKEGGHSIKRRLIIIPFNKTFTTPDENIGLRLRQQEIPGILSLLVDRCREIVGRNNGQYKVQRGGEVGQQLAEHALVMSNNVGLWANAFIEDATPDEYISSQDLYKAYTEWCERNALKRYPDFVFAKKLPPFVTQQGDIRRLVDGKRVRVRAGIKWKEEV